MQHCSGQKSKLEEYTEVVPLFPTMKVRNDTGMWIRHRNIWSDDVDVWRHQTESVLLYPNPEDPMNPRLVDAFTGVILDYRAFKKRNVIPREIAADSDFEEECDPPASSPKACKKKTRKAKPFKFRTLTLPDANGPDCPAYMKRVNEFLNATQPYRSIPDKNGTEDQAKDYLDDFITLVEDCVADGCPITATRDLCHDFVQSDITVLSCSLEAELTVEIGGKNCKLVASQVGFRAMQLAGHWTSETENIKSTRWHTFQIRGYENLCPRSAQIGLHHLLPEDVRKLAMGRNPTKRPRYVPASENEERSSSEEEERNGKSKRTRRDEFSSQRDFLAMDGSCSDD